QSRRCRSPPGGACNFREPGAADRFAVMEIVKRWHHPMAFFHFAPLIATVRQRAASFGRKLDAPLRWPKMTTRPLMILVALVALGFWAAMELPQLIERWDLYYYNAASAAQRTAEARAAQKAALARASAIQSAHDRWRADERLSDELTEHYFASRYEFAIA